MTGLRSGLAAGFVAVVFAANWLTGELGLVTVLGLTATAGTWIAGLGFVFRDWLHEAGGRTWVAGSILAGAIASIAVSPTLALASGVAFTVSELADWAVYSPLRRQRPITAALASNTVGAVLDTLIFLAIAGFPLSGTLSQVAIKVTTTAAAVALGVFVALPRQPLFTLRGGNNA